MGIFNYGMGYIKGTFEVAWELIKGIVAIFGGGMFCLFLVSVIFGSIIAVCFWLDLHRVFVAPLMGIGFILVLVIFGAMIDHEDWPRFP